MGEVSNTPVSANKTTIPFVCDESSIIMNDEMEPVIFVDDDIEELCDASETIYLAPLSNHVSKQSARRPSDATIQSSAPHDTSTFMPIPSRVSMMRFLFLRTCSTARTAIK